MEELLNRFLGFMPPRFIFWTALITMFVALIMIRVYRWIHNIAQLPWMRAENQEIRERLIQKVQKRE